MKNLKNYCAIAPYNKNLLFSRNKAHGAKKYDVLNLAVFFNM